MDEKTKKKHVEKRGTRKKRDLVSVSARPEATKKKAKKRTKLTGLKGTKQSQPTFEQVRLRAYFISEQRRSAGIGGDQHEDWLRAERELRNELLTERISIER
jgi:Protein of unknown function (DUF2934)